MSITFSSFDTARSGMGAYKLWLDAVADNVANIDNVSATEDAAGRGTGVIVEGAAFGDPNGRLAYEPNHPLADANGMVRRPDIDLSDQMVYMQVAQRGYQANINIFERAKEAYEAALSIGK
jgi:flagellar basal-body rod protein FlgC